MAMSTCIKCGNHIFEVVENEPISSRFKLLLVQCSQCGGVVVGALDYYNIGAELQHIKKKLGI